MKIYYLLKSENIYKQFHISRGSGFGSYVDLKDSEYFYHALKATLVFIPSKSQDSSGGDLVKFLKWRWSWDFKFCNYVKRLEEIG